MALIRPIRIQKHYYALLPDPLCILYSVVKVTGGNTLHVLLYLLTVWLGGVITVYCNMCVYGFGWGV
jgi:hypothetical protein